MFLLISSINERHHQKHILYQQSCVWRRYPCSLRTYLHYRLAPRRIRPVGIPVSKRIRMEGLLQWCTNWAEFKVSAGRNLLTVIVSSCIRLLHLFYKRIYWKHLKKWNHIIPINTTKATEPDTTGRKRASFRLLTDLWYRSRMLRSLSWAGILVHPHKLSGQKSQSIAFRVFQSHYWPSFTMQWDKLGKNAMTGVNRLDIVN